MDFEDGRFVVGVEGEDGEDVCIEVNGDSVDVTDCELCLDEDDSGSGGGSGEGISHCINGYLESLSCNILF